MNAPDGKTREKNIDTNHCSHRNTTEESGVKLVDELTLTLI